MSGSTTLQHIEAAYRRGYQQGVSNAGDSLLDLKLSRRDFIAWEGKIAAWRRRETDSMIPPPTPFEAIASYEHGDQAEAA